MTTGVVTELDRLDRRILAALGVPAAQVGRPPTLCPACHQPWRGLHTVFAAGAVAVCCGAARSDLLRIAATP